MRFDTHRGLLAATVIGVFLVGVALGRPPHIVALSSFLLGVAFLGQALWMRGLGDGSVSLDVVITVGACGAAIVLLAIPLVAYGVGTLGVLAGGVLVVLDDTDDLSVAGTDTLGLLIVGASVVVLLVTALLETGPISLP